MVSPAFASGIRRFRRQKRAFFSLLLLGFLFLASLPAELLCNSKPILIRYHGRFYFPALVSYTEADFGGTRKIPPDYRSRRFRELVGLPVREMARMSGTAAGTRLGAPAALSILDDFDPENGSGPTSARPGDILDLFDDEEDHGARTPVIPARSEATALLDDFDPEPWDVQPTVAAPADALRREARPAWILWPPVRYDYAYISRDSLSGRDALAAPWSQVVPSTRRTYESSWKDGHYLGTDDRGRDVLARLVYGFRVSMVFGILLAISGTVVGSLLGSLQGFFGGVIDLIGQRITEIWGSLPQLYLLMILTSFLARNIYILFVILNLTSWMGMGAYMRAEFLRGRQLDYVTAARGLGVSNLAIMFHHILPNSMTPIITFFPFNVSGGILALVSLDFLGLGVPSPYPSLGELLSQGQANLQAVWIILPTFIVLSGTVTLLTFVGDGLRNAFDPRKTG